MKLLLLFVAVILMAGEGPEVYAIRNARIITVSGSPLVKGTIVIRNGLIEAVGEQIATPADAFLIDGEGLNVYPGLIDSLSTLALPASAYRGESTRRRRNGPPSTEDPADRPARGPEDRPSNVSYQIAGDLLDVADRRIAIARNAGFTGAAVFANRHIFSGQGSLINLAGEKPGQMVVHSPIGQMLTLRTASSGYPNSLLGVFAYIRQVFLDAEHYKLAMQVYGSKPAGMKRPEYDRTLEGVLRSSRVFLPANNRREIARLLQFAKELGVPAVLYGLHEGFRIPGALKGMPALVNLRWPEAPRDSDPQHEPNLQTLELYDKAPSTPSEFVKSGVPFAFYTGGLETYPDIGRAVRRAITAGLSREDAIRAFTLNAARIYGAADRLGSLEPGKIANLVLTRGEIFEERSEVKSVFIDGVRYETQPEAAEVTQ